MSIYLVIQISTTNHQWFLDCETFQSFWQNVISSSWIEKEKESPLKKPSFCLFFSFRNLAEKWRRSLRRSSASLKSSRKLARLWHLHLHQGGASLLSSCSLSPRHHLLHLLLLNPRHQFLVNAAATVAQERKPAATSGQLPTKPPWLRQPQVFHLVILFPHPLSTTYHLLLLNLGGAKWREWRGRTYQPSPLSTWTVPRRPLHLHPHLHQHLHPHLHQHLQPHLHQHLHHQRHCHADHLFATSTTNIFTVRTVADVLIFVVSTMAAIACQTTLSFVMSAIVNMGWDTQIQRINCACRLICTNLWSYSVSLVQGSMIYILSCHA